jgi:hypothetical protein
VLFPRLSFDGAALDHQWRNAKCDVLSIWSHIHYRRHVFVTSDGNFHKETKKPRLLALGAGRIEQPADAALLLIS